MTRHARIAALAIITVGLAACGGSDSAETSAATTEVAATTPTTVAPTTTPPTTEADTEDGGGADTALGQVIAQALLAEDGSPITTEEEARCVSGQIVDGVGEDRLIELGLDTADDDSTLDELGFTPDEYDVIIDSMFDCVDLQAAFAAEFTAEFGEEGAACLAEKMDADMIKGMMALGLDEENAEMPAEFMSMFLELAVECDLDLGF